MVCFVNAIDRTFTGSELGEIAAEGNILAGTNFSFLGVTGKVPLIRIIKLLDS